MIIGTAGHVDHGKTTLLQAITGIDADRLKEEKARGITIDLGFAYWPQADGSVIGFVDVPGHRDYLHNMLAGVTGVGALLLVVSAAEGVRPQTIEHLRIAALLGIRHGVVALTKADLVDALTIAERQAEVSALLADTSLAGAGIHPVSARTGAGLDELIRALRALPRDDAGASDRTFRVAVDRVFSLPGAGTIITGPVLGGGLRLDDRVVVSPSGREARVRTIHAQNRPATEARAGERAAINLAGLSTSDLARGDMLVAAPMVAPAMSFDAALQLALDLPRPLGGHTAVLLHAGAGCWPARLSPLSGERLGPGAEGFARVALDRPAGLLAGDRFILRDAGARAIIGGGTILDIRPPARGRTRPERLSLLSDLALHGPIEALPRLLARPGAAVDPAAFAADHGWCGEVFAAVIAREGLIALAGSEGHMLVGGPVLLTALRQMREALAAHHNAHADQPGLAPARLRLALAQRFEPRAFQAIVAHALRRGEIEMAGGYLRLPGHAPRLSREHEALWREIAPQLAAEPFKPPRVQELALDLRRREDSVRGLLKRLAKRGEVFEIAPDHFLTAEAVRELDIAAGATARMASDGWFGAAAYRDRIGGGRKMAILILEFMDRRGTTIRKGDLRRMKSGG